MQKCGFAGRLTNFCRDGSFATSIHPRFAREARVRYPNMRTNKTRHMARKHPTSRKVTFTYLRSTCAARKKTTHGRTYRALAGIGRIGFDRNLALGALPRHFAAKDSRKGLSHAALLTEDLRPTLRSLLRTFRFTEVDRSVGKFDRT